MNTYIYIIYIYIYINNIFSFYYPLSLPTTFALIALTSITADRYVVANGHYGRTCAEKPGPFHNTDPLSRLLIGQIGGKNEARSALLINICKTAR